MTFDGTLHWTVFNNGSVVVEALEFVSEGSRIRGPFPRYYVCTNEILHS